MFVCIYVCVTLHVSVWVEIKIWTFYINILTVTLHVSVWVEIFVVFACKSRRKVTLHVSVWVEIFAWFICLFAKMSRSTWACELKFYSLCVILKIWLSRSTWACELKLLYFVLYSIFLRHAPRERVSWNYCNYIITHSRMVTLHVSVWVEIFYIPEIRKTGLSRSTWACELKWRVHVCMYICMWSRSTWACELKFCQNHIYK